jgi:hypothetical protein
MTQNFVLVAVGIVFANNCKHPLLFTNEHQYILITVVRAAVLNIKTSSMQHQYNMNLVTVFCIGDALFQNVD